MKIACLLCPIIIGVMLFADTDGLPDPALSDLLSILSPDRQIDKVVDETIAKIHAIVDDTIATVERNFKVTQAKIAASYQAAGSLHGDLDKAHAEETAEVKAFNAETDKLIKAAIVRVRATVKEGIDQVEAIAKRKHISQAITDDCVKHVNATMDRTIAQIEETARVEFQDALAEVTESQDRQNKLRDSAKKCANPAECDALEVLWRTEVQRCADRLKRLLEHAVADIQREINAGVAQVKVDVNPLVTAVHFVLDTLVSDVLSIV